MSLTVKVVKITNFLILNSILQLDRAAIVILFNDPALPIVDQHTLLVCLVSAQYALYIVGYSESKSIYVQI